MFGEAIREARETIRETMSQVQAREMLAAYVAELSLNVSPWGIKPSDLQAGRAILAADPQIQLSVLRSAVEHAPQRQQWYIQHTLLAQIVKRSLPYTVDDVRLVAQVLSTGQPYYLPAQALLRGIPRLLADPATLEAARADLTELREAVSAIWYESADKRKFLRLLDEILRGAQDMDLSGIEILPDE